MLFWVRDLEEMNIGRPWIIKKIYSEIIKKFHKTYFDIIISYISNYIKHIYDYKRLMIRASTCDCGGTKSGRT